MKACSPKPVHISTTGGGMCSSMASRCASFMRSRINPRISQTLSPSKARSPWPGQLAPLLGREVLGRQRQAAALLLLEVFDQVRPQRPQRAHQLELHGVAATGPRRQPLPRRGQQGQRLLVLLRQLVDQRIGLGAACAQQREDDLFLALVVGVQERQDVLVVVGHQRPTGRRRRPATPPTSTVAAPSVSRKTPCTAYMSEVSGRGAPSVGGRGTGS